MSAFAQTSVITQHNDAARTGANLAEIVLTTTNVNVSEFGKLFERAVDDEIYAQPLYVEGVNVPGVGVRNVVYVATNNDSVYAFDADDPAASAPLWRVNYTNPAAGIVPVSRTDVGQACGTYVDFAGNIGIGGTPVIDPLSQTMYFVTRTKENGTFVQRLHAIDMRDGSERPGSPLLIQASVPGTGDGRDAQNNIAFNARTHNQRAGLLLDHGTVYIAWASYCDQGPYHGWILGYDAASLQQVMVYNTTPDGGLGGIWQSGGGLAADSTGNLYALTGNGSFNGDTGGRNFGNSFIKVSPTGALLDWFTPFNWSFLNATDEDLGIQNALLIPNTNLIVGGGKEGVMYVLDRNNMGHFRSGNNGQIVQSFQASSAARMNGAPVYWNSPTYGPAIYVWPAGDPLKVFRLVGGLFTTPASAQSSALAARRHARRDAVAVGQRRHGRHRHPVGDAVARRRRQSHAAAGHPARLRRGQRDAGALEQSAERREGRARQLLEVQSADRGEREGLRGQPVEQAGRLWIDRSLRRQRRAGRRRRRRPEPHVAGHRRR